MANRSTLMKNEAILNALSAKLKHFHKVENSSELEVVKTQWYKEKLRLAAVEEVCEDHDASDIHQADGKMKELVEELKERLVTAECEQLLQPDSVRPQNPLLGISSPRRPNTNNKETNRELQQLLDEKIRKKLIAISQFYQPSPPNAGSNLVNAKASQLHNIIQRDKEVVAKNQSKIEELHIERLNQIRDLNTAHIKNLDLLDALLSKYKLVHLPEKEKRTCHYLAAKTEAFSAKLGLIETELLVESYKPDLVRELRRIRSQLDGRLAEAKESLLKAQEAYKSCLSAGTEFHQIAKEYAQLKKDIEARQWALDELKAAKQHKIN